MRRRILSPVLETVTSVIADVKPFVGMSNSPIAKCLLRTCPRKCIDPSSAAIVNKEDPMRRRLFISLGLFLGIALTLPMLEARQKDTKGATAKEDRIDGIIQFIDTATKTVTVRLRDKQQQQQVIYGDKTAFTFRNKAAKAEEVKEGRRIIALGKINDKNQLIATRIDVRDKGY
jgi:hypothetical protein